MSRTVDEVVEGLGRWGMHAKTIARVTGLSEGQVRYRLKEKGVRLREYRDGRNREGRGVLWRVAGVRVRRGRRVKGRAA